MSDQPIASKKPSFLYLLTIFGVIMMVGYLIHERWSNAHILSGVPIYNDDFNCFASTWNNFQWAGARPVLFAILWIIGLFDPRLGYLITAFVTVGYFALVFIFVARWLEITKISAPLLLLASVATVSYEYVVQCYKFTGTFAGPLAGVFSIAAMLMLQRNFGKIHKWSTSYFLGLIVGSISLFTKEDFLLPLLIFCLYFAFVERGEQDKQARIRAGTALGIFTFVAIYVFLHQRLLSHSQFFSNADSYRVNFNIASILKTIIRYLTCSTGVKISTAIQLISLTALFFKNKKQTLKVIVLNIMIISLLLPYAVLPTHFFEFYGVNWIPWQCASCFIFTDFIVGSLWAQIFAWIIVALTVPLIVSSTQALRHSLLIWLNQKELASKHLLDVLKQNRNQLNKYNSFVVIDPSLTSPWICSDGQFLRDRMKLNCRWLLFIQPNSPAYQMEKEYLHRDLSKKTIEMHETSELQSYQKLSMLKFLSESDFMISLKNHQQK